MKNIIAGLYKVTHMNGTESYIMARSIDELVSEKTLILKLELLTDVVSATDETINQIRGE